MKKYSQLLESFKQKKVVEEQILATDPIREAYVEGSIYNIGDKVETKSGDIAEIIDRGPNYVTLIKEGKTFKSWLKDIKPSQIEESKRKAQLYRESFIIKGYKTKHFSRELSELFKNLTQNNNDTYAIFNSVVCLDNLLGITEESLKEDFNKYKVDFDRATKYLKKFDMQLDEMSKVEDILLAYSIEEGIRFAANDQMKVASIIANTAGVTESGSAQNIINSAARKFKTGSHTPEAWKIIGQMLNKASQAGIKWDKSIFASHTLKYMGVEE